MKSIVKSIGATLVVLSLAACNTVEGAGQDIEKVGERIEEAAEETGGTDE